MEEATSSSSGAGAAGGVGSKTVPVYQGPSVPEKSSPPIPNTKERFFFDSDVLVLKNNLDYQRLIKTLAVLEAQKIQVIKDMECLIQSQVKAERDPVAFVEALTSGTRPPLPSRQSVAEIPNIEWKGYIESLQQVAKQHSNLYINTRGHSRPLISSLDEKPLVSTEPRSKDVNRPATYRLPWTPEEQARFEELLTEYPPEKVESKRYQKIAKALGSRTPQQVATHVQKYFIKLAQSGLPVPGRVPNMSRYSRKKRKGRGGRKGGFRRPSTFFSSLAPRVFMTDPTQQQGDDYDSSDNDSECSEMLGTEESSGGSITCGCCSKVLGSGVYWSCSDCPEENPTQLCSDCVNSDHRSSTHLPSHDLQMLSIVAPSSSSALFDKDYSSLSTVTGFNYLDPNFHPPS